MITMTLFIKFYVLGYWKKKWQKQKSDHFSIVPG